MRGALGGCAKPKLRRVPANAGLKLKNGLKPVWQLLQFVENKTDRVLKSPHAVPGNMDSLNCFRSQVNWLWYRALRRRSQRSRMTWNRFRVLVARWIPSAKILHPHPNLRFDARYPR